MCIQIMKYLVEFGKYWKKCFERVFGFNQEEVREGFTELGFVGLEVRVGEAVEVV